MHARVHPRSLALTLPCQLVEEVPRTIGDPLVAVLQAHRHATDVALHLQGGEVWKGRAYAMTCKSFEIVVEKRGLR